MKSVLVLAAATAVLAQNFSGEPACATSCLSSGLVAAGCALNDQGCQCNSATQSALVGIIGGCLLSACNSTELQQAITAGSQLCVEYSRTAAPVASSTATNGTAVATAVSNSTITSAATLTTATGTATAKTTATTAASSATSSSSAAAGAQQSAAIMGAGALAAIMGVVAAL